MRLIRTDKVPDGSTLGRDIITGRDAVPLLRAGVSIDQRYRDALAKAGIHAIYIADEQSEGIVPVPAISDEARLLTTRAVAAAFDEAKRSIAAGKSLPTTAANSLTQVVERILLEIEETGVCSLVLNSNSCADAYLIQHAIDVSALGLMIGRRLMGEQGWTDHRGQRQHGKRDERLARLGMGLLLHDIGKLAVPADILNKPGKLADSEWEVMRTHPRVGLDLIRDSSAWCPLVHAVVLRHHERWDGSGYPDGKQGDEIHEMARIAAVADAYLAITSERVYAPARPPHEGVREILDGAGVLFDPVVCQVFSRVVAPFPPGSDIQLSDGRRGIVVSVPEDELDRPLVRVIGGPGAPYEISLLDDRSIQIAGWGEPPVHAAVAA
jgi:HD-GYP domain-containing protein (c-di-GMP phosphodiesterase class II)